MRGWQLMNQVTTKPLMCSITNIKLTGNYLSERNYLTYLATKISLFFVHIQTHTYKFSHQHVLLQKHYL